MEARWCAVRTLFKFSLGLGTTSSIGNGAPEVKALGTQIIGKFSFEERCDDCFAPLMLSSQSSSRVTKNGQSASISATAKPNADPRSAEIQPRMKMPVLAAKFACLLRSV